MATCDKSAIVVSAVVGSLGVLSAILGIVAQSFPSIALAVCAIIFLLAAQITAAAVTGCCGCCKSRAFPSETKRIVGVICAVGSWLVTVIAFVLLLIDLFVVAGVLALISTALGITSYILMRSETASAELLAVEAAAIGPNNGPSQQQPPVVIMVGQPQFSPTDQAAGAQKKPAGGQQSPAGFVAMGHPHQPSPAAAAASVPNNPRGNGTKGINP